MPSSVPLLARGLFQNDNNQTCTRPLPDQQGEPLSAGGALTAHQLMIYISAACTSLTILSSIYLSWRHLHQYTAAQEQRQVLRIVNLPVAYAVFNLLAILFWLDYQYIKPIAAVYEGFAVAALFLLMLEYVCPDGTDRESFFAKLPLLDKRGNVVEGGNGSLKWFRRTWASVLQYPLSKTLLIAVEIVTQYFHVYCENSYSPKYAHIWLDIIDLLFIGGALGATIKFYGRFKKQSILSPVHRAGPKVYAFIGIITFQFLQDIIFGLLNGKLFKPSPKVTYNDLNYAVPALMTCVESLIFSLIFHWSFSATEYREGNRMDRYATGPAQRTKTFRAIIDALNPADIIAGTVIAIRLLFGRVKNRYGGRALPEREKDIGMEPLSDRARMRIYSAGGQYAPPQQETGYDAVGYQAPRYPGAVRELSPPDRARTWRADELRPEYEPLNRPRDPSPSVDLGRQNIPRDMV